MQTIDSVDSLREAIFFLEAKREEEKKLLREQLQLTKESLRPGNLAKNIFSDIASSSEIRNSIVDTGIGLVTGYLTKKLLLGGTHNPAKKILGGVLQFAVTGLVSKHSGSLRASGMNLLSRFMNRKKKPEAFYNGAQ
jgi:hypothetical protein